MHTPPHTRSRLVGVLISCSLLGSLTGCGTGAIGDGSDTSGGTVSTMAPTTTTTGVTATSTTTATTATTPAEAHPVTLYFMNEDATGLITVVRRGPNTPAKIKAALTVLAAAKAPKGALAAFPAGTEIVAVSLHDDEARVELTNAFVKGYPKGGSAAEIAVLAPIVYTATEITGVNKVTFTINGAPPRLPGSQFDWAGPFSRSDFPDLPVTAR